MRSARAIQTVLLVEDDVNDVLLMHHAFKAGDFNFPVREVTSGEQAIAYLKGEGVYSDRKEFPMPAMLILDLNMRRTNGFEVLTWIRLQPWLSHLRVVITSTSAEPRDVERAYLLGASCYIVKPLLLADLGAVVRTLREFVGIDHFPPRNGMVTR